MSQHQRKSGVGIGAAVGFLAGIGLGLLLARRRELNEDLAMQASELKNAEEAMTSAGGKEPFYESGKYT